MIASLRTTLCSVCLVLSAWTLAHAQEAPIAKTEFGSVKGKLSADGKVNVFLGIPYAAPPVGRSDGSRLNRLRPGRESAKRRITDRAACKLDSSK